MSSSENWIWDQYWHSNRIASCFDGGSQTNYQGEVRKSWELFFSSLANKSRILDLCTGNGAVPLIAGEVSEKNNKQFSITGADLANIDPARFLQGYASLPFKINFKGGVNAEDLPYENESFDVVTSQYGIEYGDVAKVFGEMARVVAAGGKVKMVIHARDGIVVKNCKVDAEEANFLLNGPLFGAAEKAITMVSRYGRGDVQRTSEINQDLQKADANFAQAVEEVAAKLKNAVNPMMRDNAINILVHTYRHFNHFDESVLLGKLKELYGEISAHANRLSALDNASIDQQGAEKWAKNLASLGFENVTNEPMFDGAKDRLIAWQIAADK